MEAFTIRDQEADTVAKTLVDEIFCRFSPPEQLHSHQGCQFESSLVKQICIMLQIFDWEGRLRKVCMAYNTSVHAMTGYTPFYLMFGREARLPLDLAYGTKIKGTSS